MADARLDAVQRAFEALRAQVLGREWKELYAGFDPARSRLLLLAAAAAAGAHVAHEADAGPELEAIHAKDGGSPMSGEKGEKGWPRAVKDKPAMFAALMAFSEKHENHHSPLPRIDWEAATLEDAEVQPDGTVTAALVEGDVRTDLVFTQSKGAWAWAFATDSVCLWGDCPQGHEPAQSPEEDLALAREALEAGDHAHAANHVAAALVTDPTNREWRALLDEVADEADDPRGLFTLGEQGSSYVTIAGRAHVLAHLGETQEAIDLIAQLCAFMPRAGFTAWAAEWVGAHRGRLEPGGVLQAAAATVMGTVGFLRLRPSERAMFEPWAPLALAVAERADDRFEHRSELLAILSGVLRRAGRLEDAARVARLGLKGRATSMAASALGLALRAAGAWDEALEAFTKAGALDATTPSAAERARVLLDAGRLEEALQEVEKEPDASPELQVMRAWLLRRTGGPAKKKTGFFARVFSREPAPPDPRFALVAARLPATATADAFTELSHHAAVDLPLPYDATANMVRDIHQKKAAGELVIEPGFSIEITLDGLEAPSGRLAAVLELGGDGSDLKALKLGVKKVQTPDPRKPRRPVRDVLWIYSEKNGVISVRQTLPPPGPDVAKAVDRLAGRDWFLPTWWRAARDVGPALGPSAVDELLGAMVRPPRPPLELDAVEWVVRHQLAGAFLLAHVDQGWAGSRRREALLSLVDGVMDWTTDAAIVALRELALDEPAALPEVEQRFWTLKDEVPTTGPWFLETLACSYLRLPGTPGDRRQAFEEIARSLRGGEA